MTRCLPPPESRQAGSRDGFALSLSACPAQEKVVVGVLADAISVADDPAWLRVLRCRLLPG